MPFSARYCLQNKKGTKKTKAPVYKNAKLIKGPLNARYSV